MTASLPVNRRIPDRKQRSQSQRICRDVHIKIKITVKPQRNQPCHHPATDSQCIMIFPPVPYADHPYKVSRKDNNNQYPSRQPNLSTRLNPVVMGIAAAGYPVMILDILRIKITEISPSNPNSRIVPEHRHYRFSNKKAAVQTFGLFKSFKGLVDPDVKPVGKRNQAKTSSSYPIPTKSSFCKKQHGHQKHSTCQKQYPPARARQQQRQRHGDAHKKQKDNLRLRRLRRKPAHHPLPNRSRSVRPSIPLTF